MLKKSSEHQKVLQPDNLSEFESIVTERPQFSRQKDFQQQQVISAPNSYKDKNKAFCMEFPIELNTERPLECFLTWLNRKCDVWVFLCVQQLWVLSVYCSRYFAFICYSWGYWNLAALLTCVLYQTKQISSGWTYLCNCNTSFPIVSKCVSIFLVVFHVCSIYLTILGHCVNILNKFLKNKS